MPRLRYENFGENESHSYQYYRSPYDYKDEMEDVFNNKKLYKIPDENKDQEIAYIYQFLKYGVADNTKKDYLNIAGMRMKPSRNYQEVVDTFNNKVRGLTKKKLLFVFHI